jgi:hypothetical protein
MVMLSTSETASTRMLAVLAYSSMTGRDVSAMLAGLAQMGRHLDVVLRDAVVVVLNLVQISRKIEVSFSGSWFSR